MREARLVVMLCLWSLVGTIGCFALSELIGPIAWKDKLPVWGVALTFWTSIVSAYIVAVNTRRQMDWIADMEKLKAVLGLQYPAYKESMLAVVRYYDALSRLQNGYFSLSACDEGETEMKRAMGTVYFLPKDFQKHWFEFWNHARYMKEASEQWPENKDAQISFWRQPLGGVKLGKLQENIADCMREALSG